MSRDTSQSGSDRRLWLSESCPSCAARPGLRCKTSRYDDKPARWLHVARGWRQRACPTCKARPGELCTTPTGRGAGRPHTARLGHARRELAADEQVFDELEQWGASVALVRFSGGGGNPGSIHAVTLENPDGQKLARWSHGEGELPEALAAPIWGRYALFRGHPHITGMLMWDARARSIMIAGQRGQRKFDEILSAPRQIARAIAPPAANPPRDTSHDTSPPDAGTSGRAAKVSGTSRCCERCGNRLAAGLRAEARYCSKRCRQAASRARLRERSGRAGLRGPDAQRRATRGPLLLKALPAGRLPRPTRARKPARRKARAPTACHRHQPPSVSDVSHDMSLPATMPATLQAAGFELVLHVEGYEFPHFGTGWDANALRCWIDVHLERYGNFHASYRPIIYTIELERFADQLQTLDRDRTGQATLQHAVEEIGLTIRLTSGTGTLEGFLADSAGTTLSFEVAIDHAFVHHARIELADLLGAYPVRGSLQTD